MGSINKSGFFSAEDEVAVVGGAVLEPRVRIK